MVARDQHDSNVWAGRPVVMSGLFFCATAAILFGALSDVVHAAPANSNVAKSVQAHLEAGEFGPALDLAMTVTNPNQQTSLLREIAAAQAKSGDNSSATATLRRISNPRTRAQAVNRQSALGGGGTMANPGPLMELIRENTSGEWEGDEGVGGNMTWFAQGVKVAPTGVLERVTVKEQSQTLASLGIQARKANLNSDLAKPSGLRMVSLTRLDRELSEHLAAGRSVPSSMALLAGLTKVQYLFVFPDQGEIVIGGPAEAWEYDSFGHPIGSQSHQPLLQLDDFVTVFRTFSRGEQDFGCSINTREENVQALQNYVQASLARGPVNAGSGVRNFVNQIQKKLGRQDIVVWGVPANSRVANVIVDADYRMKLIGIDKLDTGKAVPSYFDLLPLDLQKNPAPMEALRWWLTMKYEAVLHNAEKNVFEIRGSSVLCQSENQLLTSEGKNLPTGKSEGVNRMFAENFTKNYDQLAEKTQVFADVRNVFDLALVSSLICKEHLLDHTGGSFRVFSTGGLYQPAIYPVPKEVESVVNHRVYNGRDIVVQAAGGVRANLNEVLEDGKNVKSSPQLDQLAASTKLPELPAGRWWWDVSR